MCARAPRFASYERHHHFAQGDGPRTRFGACLGWPAPVSIGRPVEFDEASPHVAALEYALGAVGGEIVNGLREFARRRRTDIDAIEALVSGELEHALTYLEVIGETKPPRIARITVKVFVSAADDAAVRALFAEMLERLPLACTLRTTLDLRTELILTS